MKKLTKHYIKAEIQNLGESEVLNMIPPDTLARIKETDAKPEFRSYCVGHEGTANAQELSFGQKMGKAFRYIKDMIINLSDKLSISTPVFHSHIETNGHIGREKIGEVVGKGLRYIQSKLSAIAVTYIYPKFRKIPLDVASIEAEIEYIPKSKTEGEVIDIEKVTGIALGSSTTERPAFEGATLLAVVQAFTKKTEEGIMDKQEIIDAIKEGKFIITDIFTADEIMVSEPAKKAKQTEYEHAKRIEKSLGEEREKVITLTKQVDDGKTQLSTLAKQVNSGQVRGLFDTAIIDRKLDDKEKAFITKNLGTFSSDKTGEELKTEFNKFLDTQLTDYVSTVKMITGKEPVKETPPASTGTPSADGKGAATDDLTSPEKNDFIPKD